MRAKTIQQINYTRAIVIFLITFFIFSTSSKVSGTALDFENQHLMAEKDWAAQVDSLESFVNQDIVVLGRYGGTKRKWVKKGTLMKVYVIPFSMDSTGTSYDKSFLSRKDVFRGHFESFVGDTLTLIRSGNELKFDIDNLYQLKVYNEIGARVFGDMVNLTSIVGFGYSGLIFGVGAAWTMPDEAFSNAFAVPFMAIGACLGGLSYLLHRLALLIRRNKYDLVEDWYIVRSIW